MPPTGTPQKGAHPAAVRLALALALAALGPAAAGCKKDQPVHVQVEKVARRNLTELVMATGKIQPVTQVKISPEVSGEIIELPVKEGQHVRKGDLLVRIRRDLYEAGVRSAEANFRAAEAALLTAKANQRKAEAELRRNEELFQRRLLSESGYDEFRTAFEVASANAASAAQQIEMARASLKRAEEDLLKTTINSPIDGTVSKLNSEVGERVVGTGMMAGTEIMAVADLAVMEARVEVGESDVVLIAPGQRARLDVDSFRDRKFSGRVTQVARSAKTQGLGSQAEATKFEVRIRVEDKEPFLPGMSVTAEVETRYRTNVLAVPIQSVTARLPKGATNPPPAAAPDPGRKGEPELVASRRPRDAARAREVVFVAQDGRAAMRPVTRGISDDTYYEVVEGVAEGQEVVTGSFRAIARELEDGKAITTLTNRPWAFPFGRRSGD